MAKRRRRSLRLSQYDYTQAGMYFVTVCSHQRTCLFGDIVDGIMRINTLGQCVEMAWHDLLEHYSHIGLDRFVVMPNHIHGIIAVHDNADLPGPVVGAGLRPSPTHSSTTDSVVNLSASPVGAGLRPALTAESITNSLPTVEKRHALSEIVRAFKSFSARRINELRDLVGAPVWQRGYFERVIRDEREMTCIREYIVNNPLQWSLDRENPEVSARAGLRPAPTEDIAEIFGGSCP